MNKPNEKIELGDKVESLVCGFKGMVVSSHSYLSGCDRFTVQPKVRKDGSRPDSCCFDEAELKVLKKSVLLTDPRLSQEKTGGPDKYMDSGR